MKILAFDSSGMVASVALTEDDILLGEYTTNHKKTHSQTLLPMLDELMKMLSMDVKDVDVLALANGPGSFTGLRIGAATVKGLSLALDKPVVTVPTLLGLAYNMWGSDHVICPLMDARRNQVYTGIYAFCGSRMNILEEQMAIGIEELAEKLREYGKDKGIVFLGDGVPVHQKNLKENLLKDFDISFAPAHMNCQRAAAVGTLAIQYYHGGKMETAAEHKPDYLRVSQAERERAEREQAEKINNA